MTVKSDEINRLVQIAHDDPIIQKRILELLRLTAFERRSMLNIWLEQLRQRNAPQILSQLLSSLFDDAIARQTLEMINRSKIKENDFNQ
jgi:hypothetical protein